MEFLSNITATITYRKATQMRKANDTTIGVPTLETYAE